MKITLGRQIEVVKKKDSKNEKNLLKNRNSEDINELDADDIYFHSNAVKNIKLGSQLVNRIYLNHSIVYDLEDTIDLNLFHSLVPSATATSIIFDKLENQDISNYNLVGYCDANNHIAVYNNNNTEYLVLNIRNAVSYSPNNSSNFFNNYTVLINCVFDNFDTRNVTNMQFMFQNCSSLTSLDLSNFNTTKVMYMSYMFFSCSNLISLDLSSFNTANVTLFLFMFYFCRKLTNLSAIFDLTKAQNLNAFMLEIAAPVIYLKGNAAKCSNFNNAFESAKIVTIYSESFNIKSGATSEKMFNNCTRLVGGNGTTYNSSHITAEYARVDGENGLPGYFTAPANIK